MIVFNLTRVCYQKLSAIATILRTALSIKIIIQLKVIIYRVYYALGKGTFGIPVIGRTIPCVTLSSSIFPLNLHVL